MPGVTRCEHPETGGVAELPTDALAAWQARGWEPISDSRSFEAAEVERIDRENVAALAPPKPRIASVTRPTGTTAGDAGTTKKEK